MAYTPTTWVNDSLPAINSTNLNKIEQAIVDLYNAIFPIGQIVIKGDNADYSNWLGFTWQRTAVGKVLVGYDSSDTDFDTIGETGGSKTVTLTVNQIPSHSHIVKVQDKANSGTSIGTTVPYSYGGSDRETGTTGGGEAHNNLQPYQVVAYWKRVS